MRSLEKVLIVRRVEKAKFPCPAFGVSKVLSVAFWIGMGELSHMTSFA
jgi:hypothetical protein